MILEKQNQIANSFPIHFAEFEIGLSLSSKEFKLFEEGVFSKSMERKWNVFVIGEHLYWARSWTATCIFKVLVERKDDFVILTNAFVNRDANQYGSTSIENDRISLLKLIQSYLGRDDIYIDPAFEINLIKSILAEYDPDKKCIRSIGRGNTITLTRKIYSGLLSNSSDYYKIEGWDELQKKLANKDNNEYLLSLYIQDKQTREATTFYFDIEIKELLGQITLVRLK